MKKFVALLLTVALLTPLCALAEDVETAPVSNVTANAVAESENVYKITAPYSGVLLPFDLESGDPVSKGDTLFALDTVKVYAPVDGTVQAVFAETGDLCEDVTALYGMIACIERTLPQVAQASTSGAYNDEENRLIHVGETVYFYQTSDKDNEGEGRVTAVNGSDYTVELTAGDFENGDSIKITVTKRWAPRAASVPAPSSVPRMWPSAAPDGCSAARSSRVRPCARASCSLNCPARTRRRM